MAIDGCERQWLVDLLGRHLLLLLLPSLRCLLVVCRHIAVGVLACTLCFSGLVSLSELDGCIRNMLFGKYGPDGKKIWRYFRPSYIRAFTDAADIGEDRAVTGNSSSDDFVEPGEFRPCCAYLCM